ncbi:sugar ABC transporter permease, partial [Streptomyces mirabilis]
MSEPNPWPPQGPGSGPAPARTADTAKASGGRGRRNRAPRDGIRGREGLAGWLFVSPVLLVLGLFLVVPILMALWVSLSDWNGQGS